MMTSMERQEEKRREGKREREKKVDRYIRGWVKGNLAWKMIETSFNIYNFAVQVSDLELKPFSL